MKAPWLAALAVASAVTPVAEAAKNVVPVAEVDRPVVGVGETFVYSIGLTSTSGSLQMTSPLPGKIDGFDLLEQRGSPTIENGRVLLLMRYTLRARKIGSFVLGPGRVTTADGDVQTPSVKVTVVAAGTAPPPPAKAKPKRKGFFPDPFDDLLDDDFFPKPPPPPPPPPSAPPDPLAKVDALPTAPSERNTFVRLAVDDPHPVVGKPIVAKLFVYSRMNPGVEVRRMPTVPDFRIVQLSTKNEHWKPITIEGQLWSHGLAAAWTLYPLRVGKLEITGAQATTTVEDPFSGKVVAEETHAADPVIVESVEPPLEGRPPGYVLGDVVADLALVGDVAPRQIKDGHAVVQLKMKGIGRVDPLRPVLATPPGLTWTSTDDDLRTVVHDLEIEGQRRLTFDARFDRTGDFDLGDAAVNVWDPKKNAYVTVRAKLGHVTVEKAAAAEAKSGDDLPPLPPPREALGRIGSGSAIVDHYVTWAVVGGAPLIVLLAQGVAAASRKRRAAREDREASPAEQARQALEAARRCEDPLSSMTRALDRALEAKTGVRARGLTKSELARALESTTVSKSLRDRLVAAFGDLESARFAGASAPSVDDVARLCEELLSP